MSDTKYFTNLDNIEGISAEEKEKLQKVIDKYEFKISDYYLSLIDWNDPKDPIRRLVIPDLLELQPWGHSDPSKESKYTVLPGLQHKYTSTALFLVSNVCGSICRYCFRKRIFNDPDEITVNDVDKACEYIKEHSEINNVLLTGGDPLMLSTKKLDKVISKLREIEHVKIIRIGTKIPAFNPHRILDDDSLTDMISKYTEDARKIYIMVHFNHVNELTDVAVKALNKLMKAGAIMTNQTPLIRGVNDSAKALSDLFNKLSFIGVPPYYVFQCRPTLANKDFAVPIEEGYNIFEKARAKCSGLAKRARFAMSHATGKIEIIGMTDLRMYFKYHRAQIETDSAKFIIANRHPDAYWYDDYEELVREQLLK